MSTGLYRWTAAHPDWRPGCDWDREVGCVLYEAPEAVALIDPLIPPDDPRGFLEWLDALVGGRPVSVLTTIRWHRRDRERIARRYRANSSRAWNAVPRGVSPRWLRGAGEVVFWLEAAACLVPGDSLIGAGEGALELCPDGWLKEARTDRAGLAGLLLPLLELPIERVLVSHGEPVLHDGRSALARAIESARGKRGDSTRRERRG